MWRHIKIKRKYIYIPIIVAILYSVQTYCTCVCVIWNVNVNQYGAMISRHKLKRKRRKRKKKKSQQTLSQEFTHPLLFSKHNLRRSPPDMDWTLSAEILLGFSVTWCWLCRVFIRDSEDSDERLDLKKSIQLLLLLLLLPQRREKKKVHSETNKRLMVSVQALVIDDCCSTFCCKSQTPGCDLTAGFFFGRQRRYLLIYDCQRGGAAGYRACLTARKSAVRCRRSRTGVCSLRFSRNLLLQIQL